MEPMIEETFSDENDDIISTISQPRTFVCIVLCGIAAVLAVGAIAPDPEYLRMLEIGVI